MIINGEDQDSIQNTCNTKHNNPPARTVIPSHLKSLNTYPMNALMNWNSRLIGFWNWMTIHWVSGRLQCKWPQWHQIWIKPTRSRITELNIHTDGLQASADQSRGGVGGVMESRIFCIPPPLKIKLSKISLQTSMTNKINTQTPPPKKNSNFLCQSMSSTFCHIKARDKLLYLPIPKYWIHDNKYS